MRRQNETGARKTRVVCLLVIASACSSADADYFPQRSDGTRCEYAFTYLHPFAGLQQGLMSERVEGTQKIGGNEYQRYRIVYTGVPGAETEELLVRVAASGVYSIAEEFAANGEFLLYPLPVRVDEEWTVNDPAHGEYECTYSQVAPLVLQERTIESALEVSCHGLYDGRPFSSRDYFEKGIGSIKTVSDVEGVTFEFTLKRCE